MSITSSDAQVEVVERREVELRRLADVAQHDGVVLAALGHVVEQDVGDLQQQLLEALFRLGELLLERLNSPPSSFMAAILAAASPPARLS